MRRHMLAILVLLQLCFWATLLGLVCLFISRKDNQGLFLCIKCIDFMLRVRFVCMQLCWSG